MTTNVVTYEGTQAYPTIEWPEPANMINGSITVSASGASGSQWGGYGGAIVNATIPVALLPIYITCGLAPTSPGANGGAGFSGGGGGGFPGGFGGITGGSPTSAGTSEPAYPWGNGGGGSTGIVSGASATFGQLLVEAGGADGWPLVTVSTTYGPPYDGIGIIQYGVVYTEFGQGGGGGYSGDAGGQGVGSPPVVNVTTPGTIGNGGGGGGSQGGSGGNVLGGGLGGAGTGSTGQLYGGEPPTGTYATTTDGGTGGGGGGTFVSQGVASSYASSLCTSFSFGQQPTPGGAVSGANGGNGFTNNGGVQITYVTADAPLASTLVSPANNSQTDTWANGVTFTGTYETDASGDTGALQAVCLVFSFSGVIYYYNGGGLSLEPANPIWLLPTTGGGVTTGENFTLTVPPGIIADGQTFLWSFYTQESFVGLQSPLPSGLSLSTVVAPSAVITAPIGTVTGLGPTVTWTGTYAAGTGQTAYRFMVYQEPTIFPGNSFSSPVYDSGTVTSGTASFTLPTSWQIDGAGAYYTPLSGTTYYGYLLITGTGGNVASDWASCTFTPTLYGGATPVLTATASTEPTTGMPAPYLSATFADSGLGQTLWSQYQCEVNGVWTDIMGGNPVNGSSTASNVFALDAPFNVSNSYRMRTYYYSTGQYYYSVWSNTATVTVSSIYWWIVPPTALESSMQLFRLGASAAGSTTDTTFTPTTPAMPGSLEPSIIIDDLEQLGTFRPFGKSTAIMVHGDVWGDEFDLNLFFESSAAWTQFKTIRNLQAVVLLKSDMEGTTYWVTMGGDLAPGIITETGRQSNPWRGLTVHCTPTDPYVWE